MSTKSVTMAVYAPAYLPTILTGDFNAIALRVPSFTVQRGQEENQYEKPWLITTGQLDEAALGALLDALPVHMASIHSWTEPT